MDILTIIGLVIGLIIVVAIVAMAFIAFDLMSYTATGSETLNPAGNSKGNALVVYDPGLSGAGKKAAMDIAEDLKSKGYKVDLAGVRSKTAVSKLDYDIIIAGGPMYWGKVSKSIDTYLKTLKLPENVKIGVFGTTGSVEFHDEDIASLEKQVASNLSDSKAVTKTLRSGEANKKDCEDFVFTVTQ
jgi:flavorubredoxin